jgi:tetratricopeptide (TPR) repeat protein
LRASNDLYQDKDSLWQPSQKIVDALHKANCLTRGPGEQWRLVENTPQKVANLGLPDSIQTLIQIKLSQLPESLLTTLQTASVIGQRVEFDLLTTAHPAQPDPTPLLKQLIQLQELDFIHQEKLREALVYQFKHSLINEVIYASLSKEQARQFHQAVAKALERRQPEAIELLAYHYSRGGIQNKILTFLDQAAVEAQRKFANETALGYYTQALAVEERWAWRRNQVRTLHILGRREEEKLSLQALGANLETPTFQVGLLWGQYYEAVGDYPKAQEAIELALADSRDKEDLIGEARSLSYLGLIARRQGNYKQARAWYKQALARFKEIPSLTESEARELTRVLNGLGAVYSQQGDFEQARKFHTEALTLSHQHGNRAGEAQACNDLGVIAFYQRRLGEALTYQQQALEIRRAIGNRVDEAISLHNLAQVTHDTGDYDQTQVFLTESLRILRTTGNRWEEINVLNDLGIFYQELGDWSKAEACLQQGLALAQEIGDQAGQAYVLANLGLVARDKSKFEKAENLFTTGLILARAQNDQYLVSNFQNYLSIVSVQMGQPEQAISQAKSSLVLRQELKMRFATPDNLAILAASYLAMGELTQALEWATQAESILDECAGEGPEFSQQDYFIIHQVLAAAGESERAKAALQQAYQLVTERADKISNRFLRQTFLERVTINREIVSAYLASINAPAEN